MIPFDVLAFDPSINHTGWAWVHFVALSKEKNGGTTLVEKGLIRSNGARDGNARYQDVFTEADHVIRRFRAGYGKKNPLVAIEWPTFEDSERGRLLIRKRGLTKLAAVAGGILSLTVHHQIPYALVTAWQWKGATGKPTIRRRVEEITGNVEWIREDEWEAAGLAIWANRHPGKYMVFGGCTQ